MRRNILFNSNGVTIPELLIANGMLLSFVLLFGTSFSILSKMDRSLKATNERMFATNQISQHLKNSKNCKCLFNGLSTPKIIATTTTVSIPSSQFQKYTDFDACTGNAGHVLNDLHLEKVQIDSVQLSKIISINNESLIATLKIKYKEPSSNQSFESNTIAVSLDVEENGSNLDIKNCKNFDYKKEVETFETVFAPIAYRYGMRISWVPYDNSIPFVLNQQNFTTKDLIDLSLYPTANYINADFLCSTRLGTLGDKTIGYIKFLNGTDELYRSNVCIISQHVSVQTNTDAGSGSTLLRIPTSATHIEVGGDFEPLPGSGMPVGTRRVAAIIQLVK